MGIVKALVVVEGDPAPDADPSLRSGSPSMQIDAFILQGPPQPLDEDVVDASDAPGDTLSPIDFQKNILYFLTEGTSMITSSIKQRIINKGRGAIFAPSDFLDIGSRASVDQALSRLADQGVIRRLTRGLYDYPKKSPRFGFLSPSADDIAKAVARKDGQILQPSPSMAANQLGLTTQVPSKPTYMTDGPTRTKKVGRQVIQFRNASPKTLVGAGHKTGIVFQALRYVGKDRVDGQIVDRLARALDDNDRKLLAKQSIHAPAWMHPIVQQIVSHA